MKAFHPQAILFDLDGTLADTAPDLAHAVNMMRLARGLEKTPYKDLRPHASAGAKGLIGAAFNITPGDAAYENMRIEFLHNYSMHIANESHLFEGIAALLQYLNQNNIAWGIVTNKHAQFTDALIPHLPLSGLGCVISGDTTPHAKPHPAPLLEACKRLNVEPTQCWYAGDDLRDIQAAHAAQMYSVAAAWGYCGTNEPLYWNANSICHSPQELQFLLIQ